MGDTPSRSTNLYGTTSSAYLKNAFEACVALGCSEHDLIIKIPGGHKALARPATRFDSTILIDMLHYAEELSGKVGICALTGGYLRPSAMADLGHAMVASSTLEEMIKMYRVYQPLLLQIGETDVSKRGDRAYVTWKTDIKEPEYLRPYVEKFFGGVAAFGRWVTWDQDMQIIGMHFRHSEPADLTAYEDIFRCPLYFNADEDIMEVPRGLVEHDMPQPNPALVANIRQIMDRDLAELETPLTAAREVFQIIRTVLVEGPPTIGRVADLYGTTERTLRRRLKDEGTTYRNLLEEVRKETCEFELKRGTHCILDLAQSLGYSDQSAFTRAFKDWYDMPPSQYIQTKYQGQ